MSLLAVLWAGALAASEAGECASFVLSEHAEAAGLDFVHSSGAAGEKHVTEPMGAGVAWLDFDQDGWLDLYLVQSGPFPAPSSAVKRDRLFRNLGDGTYEEWPTPAAPPNTYGQGVVAADVDGDGDTDLYLTNYGADQLLLNQADGTFVDATSQSGLGLGGWSSSAAFGDADADGDLDLYVTRYLVYDPEQPVFCGDVDSGVRKYCGPALFEGQGDHFFRNLGGGRFADETEVSGIAPADGRGLGVLFIDLDGDRAPEIYVANDLTLNLLFHNQGDGTFVDSSLLSGVAVNANGRPEAGMGVTVFDKDGDLDPDLAVTNFDVETNTLYENLGGLIFSDVSAPSGFGAPSLNYLAFGLVAEDLDLDGDHDLYVANGHIFEEPARENVTFEQVDLLFAGDGSGGFSRVVCGLLDALPTVARGATGGDYDNDGDPDLVVQERDGPVRLLKNGASGHWLGARLQGAGINSEAVGAEVIASSSGKRQARWVIAGDSYQSSSDRRVRFGLAESSVDEILVTWPTGGSRRLVAPPVGRYLTFYE